MGTRVRVTLTIVAVIQAVMAVLLHSITDPPRLGWLEAPPGWRP
jgi:hypothetical protein